LREFKPSEVLSHINRGLINCKLGKHVTMVGGVIDEETGLLTYSIGGHLPLPVLYTPTVSATWKAWPAGGAVQ
jgi:serine phosphatase RsbU (regulator of sigma subunit)